MMSGTCLDLDHYSRVHGRCFTIKSFREGAFGAGCYPSFHLEARRGISFLGAAIRLHVINGMGTFKQPLGGLQPGRKIRPVAGKCQIDIGEYFYSFPLAELAHFHVDFDPKRGFISIHPVRLTDGGDLNLGFYLRIESEEEIHIFHRAQALAGFDVDGIRHHE